MRAAASAAAQSVPFIRPFKLPQALVARKSNATREPQEEATTPLRRVVAVSLALFAATASLLKRARLTPTAS